MSDGEGMAQALRPDDPALLDRALGTMRGKGYVAIELRRGEASTAEGLVESTDFGRVRVRWRSDDDVRAVVSSPHIGLATRFRLQAKRHPDGRVVLHGRAFNLTHWIFAAGFAPVVFVMAAVVIGTAVEGLWGPSLLAAVVLAIAVFGFLRLGTRRGFVALRAGHLLDLALMLWQREGTPVVPRVQ